MSNTLNEAAAHVADVADLFEDLGIELAQDEKAAATELADAVVQELSNRGNLDLAVAALGFLGAAVQEAKARFG